MGTVYRHNGRSAWMLKLLPERSPNLHRILPPPGVSTGDLACVIVPRGYRAAIVPQHLMYAVPNRQIRVEARHEEPVCVACVIPARHRINGYCTDERVQGVPGRHLEAR